MVAPLSVCEVEVTPKGPSGNRHILQTAGGMWPLQLQGVALDPHDRIRIVADTVLCGLEGSATMHDAVLALTAPMGQRAHGDFRSETWENIQVNRMGIYKVCWCGGDGDCSADEHFSMHVATLIINGIMLTVVGDGRVPNRTIDMVDGAPGFQSPLGDPFGIAVSNQRVFFTERGTHMLRWLDIEEGRVYTLAGQFFPGVRGDFGSAFNAQLSTPLGLALDRDHTSLYIADYGSDRVRKIDLTQDPLNRGIIETVAGNGFRGFSGDGGPAREAQLNGPSGVAVDLNQMLWICDSGNNVLRVVSMEIPVRIPGSNEFQANVILTAAGGSTGQSQGKGDGGVAWLARMQGPSGVAVSSAFVSNEDGTLPVNVYIAESMGQQVRSMSLEFQSYLGVINTLAGSGQRGNDLQEGLPLEAPNAELNEPSGVATDAGLVYLSDSANNRLLMMPALEYVSMGCWRENIESPWIPSIEGEPLPWGIDYLQGIPENRPAAITACALATLRLGYEVFAIRQMGVCATSKDAHLYFRFEGSSTSCDQGKGGARDNSVYRFARQGMMTQQQGLVYVLAGREGDAGFAGDQGSAWVTQLNRPNGLGVNPMTKDIYVADSGNNRIRLIFSQIGPGVHHSGYCTNGLACEVTIMGNGLLPGNKLAVIPMEQSCGQPGVMFQMGLAMNPTSEIPSPSFTQKTFNFGPPSVPRTGTYRLCFCVKDAVVFGQITPCNAAEFFIHDAGIVRIVGPDSRIDDAEVVEGMPGRPLALAIFGHELSLFDRVRLVNDSQPCGVPGAEVLAEEVQSRDILMGRRYQGNESFSLWVNVTLRASGSFRVCWCQGARIDGTRLRCERGEDFRVEAARVNIRGPIQYVGTIKTGSYEEIAVKGGQLAGFSSSDRIRLVDAATVQCGSMEAQAFSISIENEQVDAVPSGAPHRITADSVTWTNVKVRTSQPLRVCWCGDTEACSRGEDFVIDAALIAPLGPTTHPRQILEFGQNGTFYDVELAGIGFDGREYIRIVDDYTRCGTRFSDESSLDVSGLLPNQASQVVNMGRGIRWRNIKFLRPAAYRVCYCYCGQGKNVGQCCQLGEDFYTDIASIFVAIPRQDGTEPVLQAPMVVPDMRPMHPPPGLWGVFPKDITRTIRIRAQTRRSPAHAGSVGPIEVKIFQVWPSMTVLATFQLTDLATGQLQGFEKPVLLDVDGNPHGIEVVSHSMDAWYPEWIEVDIEGIGSHRFQMEGWTASPADRQVRYVTQGLQPPPMLPTMLPPPNVELWESHAFVLDACGGCRPGFQCTEEEASMVERLQRESLLGLIWDEDGASDPEAARLAVYLARCRPVCGDGQAQPGEQCDDGNLRSLDGCSGRCQVESGFECANFADAPSSCWPRLCDADTGIAWNGMKAGLFPLYGEQEFAQMSSLGATCSIDTPLQYKVRKEQCLQVSLRFEPPVQPDQHVPGMAAPGDFAVSQEAMTVWNRTMLNGHGCARVMVPMSHKHGTLKTPLRLKLCPLEILSLATDIMNTTWLFRLNTYDDCARMCENDQECMAVMFHVDDPAGGQECGPDSRLCSAHCQLVDGCDTMPMEGGVSADQYHIGRKIQKEASELPGNSICTEVDRPMPVHAYDAGGVTIVQFDSPVEPPAGVTLNQAFFCSHILWETSQVRASRNPLRHFVSDPSRAMRADSGV
ncbi:SOQ1 [Symbiodinium sp. KB8]|nr:SOQ1 [Symbiodinium sp. KB8]